MRHGTYLPEGVAPPRSAALDAFWAAACAAVPDLDRERGYSVRWIGSDAQNTRAIFEVIRRRDKTGTFTLPWVVERTDQPPPRVGDALVLVDFLGVPTLLVRLTAIHEARFGAVTDADIAVDGTPVRSLEKWIPLHTRYWGRILAPFDLEPSPEMPFWVERFELLYDAEAVARAG